LAGQVGGWLIRKAFGVRFPRVVYFFLQNVWIYQKLLYLCIVIHYNNFIMDTFNLKPLEFDENDIAVGIRRYELEQIILSTGDEIWEADEVYPSRELEYPHLYNCVGKYRTKEEAIAACNQNEQKVLTELLVNYS
jgi:hypothetical protein